MSALTTAMATAAEAVEQDLADLVPECARAQAKLDSAMRYALLGGGKRLRPFLVRESAKLFDSAEIGARRVAAAIEMVHTYSLVHDDLPAMDDDDLRRGRPTTHIAYDEATAILVGDGLLTLAFEVLADPKTHPDPGVRSQLVCDLAQAAGKDGMVGGQAIDLAAETETLDLDRTAELQRLKTGALIDFSCIAGARLGGGDATQFGALRAYAADLGLAFQIADDLLDVVGNVEEMGKGVGKDAAAGKATFVSLLGVEGATARAGDLIASARGHLSIFDARASLLRQVTDFVVARTH